jgi:hypothetical protein
MSKTITPTKGNIMNEIKATKTGADYAGNTEYTITVNGETVATVRKIKRENFHYNGLATATRPWIWRHRTAGSLSYRTLDDAIFSATRRFQ